MNGHMTSMRVQQSALRSVIGRRGLHESLLCKKEQRGVSGAAKSYFGKMEKGGLRSKAARRRNHRDIGLRPCETIPEGYLMYFLLPCILKASQ